MDGYFDLESYSCVIFAGKVTDVANCLSVLMLTFSGTSYRGVHPRTNVHDSPGNPYSPMSLTRTCLLFIFAIFLLSACTDTDMTAAPDVERQPFGIAPSGDSVDVFRVTNGEGMEMRVTEYGGIIVSLVVPGRDGPADVVLGFDSLAGYTSPAYEAANPYFGAIIGRYGNRVGGAEFTLNGQSYELDANDGSNHLHGGEPGFDELVWTAEPFETADSAGVVLSRVSPDGEEGYPGRLEAEVTYALTTENALSIQYEATSTDPTPVNLTQHSYFNLEGEADGTILDHELQIPAQTFTPVDSTLIPTGQYRSVDGTPFDFREPTSIGARIDAENRQLGIAAGYDHNFVLSRQDSDTLHLAARLYDPDSGREMEVLTTEPGLQFYSGNFLDGSLTGKSGRSYQKHAALALETQHFPNSPNQANFPSTILRPGETYTSRTVYQFSVREPS